MIDLLQIDDSKLNKSMQLLRDGIAKRGWKATIPFEFSSHCFIDRGDGQPLHIFASSPPTTSYAAGSLANDKYATYSVLKEIDVNQPETVIADPANLTDAKNLLAKYGKIVVKPSDAGHGKGVTVGVLDERQLTQAIDLAMQHNRLAKTVIVQEQFDHSTLNDLRLLCIDYKLIGVIWRVPANVKGDGIHSVIDLIKAENESPKRGVPYFAELATIEENAALTNLGSKANDIPADGEVVQVMSIANYGAGGEIHDVTDSIPAWLVEKAELVARTLQLPVCGVDIITSSMPTRETSMDQLEWCLLEVNKAPALSIHDLPSTGKPRGSTEAYLSYLATI